METVQIVLAVIGAIAVGLPMLLRAILLILKAIPGEQGEAFFEAAVGWADKIAELAGKLYPQSPSAPKE